MPLYDKQSHQAKHNFGKHQSEVGYLVGCSMKSCLENSHNGDVEEEQYPRVDINWPVVTGIKVEVIGGRAVSGDDDVLQSKES